jgi:hypothetical protein
MKVATTGAENIRFTDVQTECSFLRPRFPHQTAVKVKERESSIL